jgi:hypothetical protein
MNEITSLFLATSVLAICGMGIYMYSSHKSDDQEGGEDENINEYSDIDVIEPKTRSKNEKVKTKRNRKSSGTKRRY